MSAAVYAACAATSLLCAVLLLRAWRTARVPLLLWSGLCFVFLTANNLLLFFDLVLFPSGVDLRPYRLLAALAGLAFLLYGFIFESE